MRRQHLFRFPQNQPPLASGQCRERKSKDVEHDGTVASSTAADHDGRHGRPLGRPNSFVALPRLCSFSSSSSRSSMVVGLFNVFLGEAHY